MAAQRVRSASPSVLSTFALVALAMAALFAIDMFLARMEHSETAAEAARLFRNGELLAREGRTSEAIASLRAAVFSARDNAQYQLELAKVLLTANKLADAEATLTALLQRNATGGEANLLMARTLVKQGRPVEAESYYHMAIYGQWPQDAAANRVKARFELVDLFARQNDRQDLLAELLPLQGEAPADLAVRRRIAHLFLKAGSPARAADSFRQILRQQRDDPDAYFGLGEAEIALANYRVAQGDFQMAARLRPDDADIRRQLDLCNQVLALDPMLRGLSVAERYRRSRKLIELALDSLTGCPGASRLLTDRELGDLADRAQRALNRRVNAVQENDAIEMNLDLVEQLWQARRSVCPQPAPTSEEPLALVLARLSR